MKKDRYLDFVRIAEKVKQQYYNVPYGIPCLHAAIHISTELIRQRPNTKRNAIKLVKGFAPLSNHPFHVSAMDEVRKLIIIGIENL